MADVQVRIYLAIAINYRCGGFSVAAQAGKLLSEGTLIHAIKQLLYAKHLIYKLCAVSPFQKTAHCRMHRFNSIAMISVYSIPRGSVFV
jgi:hypothetical protein